MEKYNPKGSYEFLYLKENEENAKKIGMKLVTNFCYDMDYKYMYGQNMLFLSWQTTMLPGEDPRLTELKNPPET